MIQQTATTSFGNMTAEKSCFRHMGNPLLLSRHRRHSMANTRLACQIRKSIACKVAKHEEKVSLSPEEQERMDRLASQLLDKLSMSSPDDTLGISNNWVDLDEVNIEEQEQSSRSNAPPPRRRGGQTKQIPIQALPKVAIIGRPNVGKSALFNRLTKTSLAIVYDYPGVTRDRLYTRGFWGDKEFVVVDTGGLVSKADKLRDKAELPTHIATADQLPAAIERQALEAIDEADSLVFVVDGQAGSTAADEEVAMWLRKTYPNKPVVLAVNKCENPQKADLQAAEFWNMGMQPFPISAISGTGTGEMMDELVQHLAAPKSLEEEEEAKPLAVSIIGRPNVGKSSLLNGIVGKQRSIVSDVSGTTRDAIDTAVELPDGRKLTLIDTAGIRRRTAVASSRDGAEPLSVGRSFKAIRRSDVVVLVLDAVQGVTQQDFRLAEIVASEGKACVVVMNKWDAVEDKDSKKMEAMTADVTAQLRAVEWATVLFTSALKGTRVNKILDAVIEAGEQHKSRVSTATLNLVVQEATAWRPPPSARGSGKKARIYYATQAATRPPSFVLFVNDPKLITDDYKRYIDRQLRENIGLPGTPIRLFLKGKVNTRPPPKRPEY